jgi:protein gp37
MTQKLQTSIQWADFTLNGWEGCDKVDDDCLNCYMYRDMERYGRHGKTLRKISLSTVRKKLKAALKLVAERRAVGDSTPVRIFMSSWTDVFLKRVPKEWRDELWFEIQAHAHPQIVIMILTKRPEDILAGLPADFSVEHYKNVWIGTSVGSTTDRKIWRICDLLSIKALYPWLTIFLSCEPLTGSLNLRHIDAELAGHPDIIQVDALTGRHTDMARPYFDLPKIDWVIVGGESGNETGKYGYRECKIEWIKDIVRQCVDAGVPVFVKQLGTFLAKKMKLKDRHGGDPAEWPEDLQITQHPQ